MIQHTVLLLIFYKEVGVVVVLEVDSNNNIIIMMLSWWSLHSTQLIQDALRTIQFSLFAFVVWS